MTDEAKLPTLCIGPTDEAYMRKRSAAGLGFTVMASWPVSERAVLYVPRAQLDEAREALRLANLEIARLRKALTAANLAMRQWQESEDESDEENESIWRAINAIKAALTPKEPSDGP